MLIIKAGWRGHWGYIARVLVAQSCLTLCNPMDCSPPGSSFHGTLQARILEWVTIPFSRGSSQPRGQNWVSCTAGRFFIVWVTRVALFYICACLSFSITFSVTDFLTKASVTLLLLGWEGVSDRTLTERGIILLPKRLHFYREKYLFSLKCFLLLIIRYIPHWVRGVNSHLLAVLLFPVNLNIGWKHNDIPRFIATISTDREEDVMKHFYAGSPHTRHECRAASNTAASFHSFI